MRSRCAYIAFLALTIGVALPPLSQAQIAGSTEIKTAGDNKVVLTGKVIDDQVVDERGKLIAGATVRAMYASKADYDSTPENVVTASDGTFKLMRKERPLFLKATTPDQRQAGFVRVEADQRQATISVAPLARATGQLVDKTGKPVQLGHILYLADDLDRDPLGAFGMFTAGVAILDSDGRFTMTALLPGQQYSLAYTRRGGNHSDNLGGFVPASAGEFNLGKVPLRVVLTTNMPVPTLRFVVDNPPAALERQQRLSKLLNETFADLPYDFLVQRAAGTNESTNLLPEELAENLVQVNGVKRVGPRTLACALVDLVDFKQQGVTGALAMGWAPHSPLVARFKSYAGGQLFLSGNQNTVLLGKQLAKELGKSIGNKIDLYGENEFHIVDVYESPIELANRGLVMPLEQMQRVMGTPGEISGFAIAADRPLDEQGLDDLRQRLEAVQPGLEVTRLRHSAK